MDLEIKEYRERLEKKIANGLTDQKFFTADLSESTMSRFCREVNAIDRAIESKSYTKFDFSHELPQPN